MEAFLDLSLWTGLALSALLITIPGLIIIFLVRKLADNHIKKGHEKVGRLLFKVTASLIALLISLSFANEQISYNKVTNSLEAEASIIASTMLKLRIHNTKTAELVRKGLMDYVKYTIDDHWKVTEHNPYLTRVMGTMERINIQARALSTDTELRTILKAEIIDDIDEITKTMQIRFHTNRFDFPYLIYILGFGMLIAWCFFTVYDLDRIGLGFITLYNIFIGVLLYFIIMLGNPMVGALKIEPAPFTKLLERNNSGTPL